MHRSTRLEHRFTEFSEITQCNGHYAVQTSRLFKFTDFGINRKLIYDFLLVINTNLHPILHRFEDMADYWSVHELLVSSRSLKSITKTHTQ